ncbi:carbohydrate binding protein with CBM15 domain [Alteromonadaceae bacterium 2753L.S.0a.02]|nr:carbohydrate binding protein with CBM15 domain [Alteromonadaceae bacterium 2753L.S.0a.02]
MGIDTYASGDASATLSVDSGNLVLTPTWDVVSDTVTQNVSIRGLLPDYPVDITGGSLMVRYHLPDAYVQDGNLSFQPHAFTSAWAYVGLGEHNVTYDVDGDGWGILKIDNLPAGTDITRLGIQVKANGMAGDVTGSISFDYLVLTLADDTVVTTPPTQSVDLTANWNNDYQTQPVISYDANGVVVSHDWSSGNGKAQAILPSTVDFEGAQLEMVINVDPEYDGEALALQLYVQQNSGSYSGAYAGWTMGITSGDYTLSHTFTGTPADIGRVGVELIDIDGSLATGGLTAPFTIKSVTITYP